MCCSRKTQLESKNGKTILPGEHECAQQQSTHSTDFGTTESTDQHLLLYYRYSINNKSDRQELYFKMKRDTTGYIKELCMLLYKQHF